MGTLSISVSLILIIFASTGHAQSCNWSDPTYVSCNHTTPVCECTKLECYFCLEIEQRHTFTRYFLTEKETDIPGYGGRVWSFNDQGQLEELPPEGPNDNSSTSCANNDPRCTEAITVDGNSFRSILTINNRFPGPTLIVRNNSIVVVDVYNKLSSEATSIHWHGMHQMNTPWMDGVEHITQCGIAPSSSFRYIFRASPPGTHWYHSHSGAQRTDGLFGALIVKETVEHPIMHGLHPFIDKPENVITLLDWQKENSLDLFAQIHAGIRYFDQDGEPPGAEDSRQPRTCSPDGTEVGPVTYWSGLINGRGRHRDTPYNKTLLSRFNVETHENYRFRLIGAQSLFAYRFSIDEHNLTLIATDGHLVNQTIVDFIIVHSGERYDFILETKNPAEIANSRNNFIIRAETLEVDGSNPNVCGNKTTPNSLYPLYTDHNAEAILHYGKESDIINNTMYEAIANGSKPKYEECARKTNKNCIAVNCPFANFSEPYGTCITCMPIHELNLLVPPTNPNQVVNFNTQKTLFFNFGFEGDGSTSAVNGRNFVFPPKPLQLDPLRTSRPSEIPNICDRSKKEICDKPNRRVTDECLCTHIFDIEGGETYRFVFTAIGPDRDHNYLWNFAHPIHLHGHSFHVAKIGFGTYSDTGRIQRASDDVICNNSYICTSPQWSNNNLDMGRNDSLAPLKDTVLIPAGGYAVVYFKANNPGYWFLHCHIEVHQLEGMAVVINENRQKHNSPPDGMPECGSFTWDVPTFIRKSSSSRLKESLFLILLIGLFCIMLVM